MNDLKAELASLRIDRGSKPRSGWRWMLYLGFFILVAAGLGFYFIPGSSLTAAEVETVRPTVQNFSQAIAGSPILTASGYIVARRQAVVSAKIQGRLSQLMVEEGSKVREGEIIARLDSADYQAQVEVARAQVQHAEADLAEQQRQQRITEKLTQARVDSQDQLDAAISRVRLAEAALSQSRANLTLCDANYQNTLIRAPFAGVVVKKMAEVGESVAPIPPGVNISTASGAIVALADMATLEIEVDVSESNVAKLQPDQPAEVSVEAFPDRNYRAVLRQVIPTADRTKATVTVKVTILDKDKDLKPEMTAKATFLEPAKKGEVPMDSSKPIVTVPKDAITTRQGKSVVFEVRDDKKVYELPITTGTENQDQVIIKQGLAGSETLVLHPADKLREGDVVKVKG
ncbi:MAG TPA: efflux RND transporter periplasmic adaptor subunit [Terriglobales bacterium]|jgi:HlyD family secretion protein|nr:efflux RND transporter periplasmic adaptor subunit [Terriglobales bacterium]